MEKNDNSPASNDIDYLDLEPARMRYMFTREKISLSSKLHSQHRVHSDDDGEEVCKGTDDKDSTEEVPEIEKETHRLAVVNMNWSNTKAADLYALFYPLVAPNGLVKSVAIYPTELGLQRIKEEEEKKLIKRIKHEEEDKRRLQFQDQPSIYGPFKSWLIDNFGEQGFVEHWKTNWPVFHFEFDDDPWKSWPTILYDDDEKSRYYFAMVECDSCDTALQIYKKSNGVRFEYEANPLDLRFIPDDMDFKHPPQDVATITSLTPSLVRYWEKLIDLIPYHDQGRTDDDDDGRTDDDDQGTYTHLKLFLQ